MNRHLFAILFVFMVQAVYATSQIPDIIIWKGDTLGLFSNPLKLHPEWKTISKVIQEELEEEDKKLYPSKYLSDTIEIEELSSTACSRGYIAEWKVIGSRIYLSKIMACHDSKLTVDLKKIFRKEINNDILFANWITDDLIVVKGECIEHVNLGYQSIFQIEIVVRFNSGILTSSRTYNNYIAKKSKYSSDPNPNNFLEFIYSQVNWGKFPDIKKKYIVVSVGIQPNSEGQIDSLLIDRTYLLDSNTISSDLDNIYIKEAIRIARLIPDWDVVYQRDTIVPRSFGIIFHESQKKKYGN